MAEKVCDRYCRRCIYYLNFSGGLKCCNYLLMTDKRRPRDPGKGCTVRALKERQTIKNRKERRTEDG